MDTLQCFNDDSLSLKDKILQTDSLLRLLKAKHNDLHKAEKKYTLLVQLHRSKCEELDELIKKSNEVKRNLAECRFKIESLEELNVQLQNKQVLLEKEYNSYINRTETRCQNAYKEIENLRKELENLKETPKSENAKLLRRSGRISKKENECLQKSEEKLKKYQEEKVLDLQEISTLKEKIATLQDLLNKERTAKELKASEIDLRQRIEVLQEELKLSKQEYEILRLSYESEKAELKKQFDHELTALSKRLHESKLNGTIKPTQVKSGNLVSNFTQTDIETDTDLASIFKEMIDFKDPLTPMSVGTLENNEEIIRDQLDDILNVKNSPLKEKTLENIKCEWYPQNSVKIKEYSTSGAFKIKPFDKDCADESDVETTLDFQKFLYKQYKRKSIILQKAINKNGVKEKKSTLNKILKRLRSLESIVNPFKKYFEEKKILSYPNSKYVSSSLCKRKHNKVRNEFYLKRNLPTTKKIRFQKYLNYMTNSEYSDISGNETGSSYDEPIPCPNMLYLEKSALKNKNRVTHKDNKSKCVKFDKNQEVFNEKKCKLRTEIESKEVGNGYTEIIQNYLERKKKPHKELDDDSGIDSNAKSPESILEETHIPSVEKESVLENCIKENSEFTSQEAQKESKNKKGKKKQDSLYKEEESNSIDQQELEKSISKKKKQHSFNEYELDYENIQDKKKLSKNQHDDLFTNNCEASDPEKALTKDKKRKKHKSKRLNDFAEHDETQSSTEESTSCDMHLFEKDLLQQNDSSHDEYHSTNLDSKYKNDNELDKSEIAKKHIRKEKKQKKLEHELEILKTEVPEKPKKQKEVYGSSLNSGVEKQPRMLSPEQEISRLKEIIDDLIMKRFEILNLTPSSDVSTKLKKNHKIRKQSFTDDQEENSQQTAFAQTEESFSPKHKNKGKSKEFQQMKFSDEDKEICGTCSPEPGKDIKSKKNHHKSKKQKLVLSDDEIQFYNNCISETRLDEIENINMNEIAPDFSEVVKPKKNQHGTKKHKHTVLGQDNRNTGNSERGETKENEEEEPTNIHSKRTLFTSSKKSKKLEEHMNNSNIVNNSEIIKGLPDSKLSKNTEKTMLMKKKMIDSNVDEIKEKNKSSFETKLQIEQNIPKKRMTFEEFEQNYVRFLQGSNITLVVDTSDSESSNCNDTIKQIKMKKLEKSNCISVHSYVKSFVDDQLTEDTENSTKLVIDETFDSDDSQKKSKEKKIDNEMNHKWKKPATPTSNKKRNKKMYMLFGSDTDDIIAQSDDDFRLVKKPKIDDLRKNSSASVSVNAPNLIKEKLKECIRISEANQAKNNPNKVFKKPEKCTILPQCPKSPDVTNYVATEPKLIPLERTKIDIKQIKELVNMIATADWSPQLMTSVAQALAKEDVKDVAKAFVSVAAKDYSQELIGIYTPPAPKLTVGQQKLLVLLSKVEKGGLYGIYDCFIRLAERKLLSTKKLEVVHAVARIYVAYCRLKFDIEQVRLMCCNAAYQIGDFFTPVMYIVLTSWAEVLPHAAASEGNYLALVLVQVMRLKTCANPGYNLLNLKCQLKSFYGYNFDPDNNDELMKKLLSAFSETCSKAVYTAILILCKNLPQKWCYTKIKGSLMPLVENLITDTSKYVMVSMTIVLIVRITEFLNPKPFSLEIWSLYNWMMKIATEHRNLSNEVKASIDAGVMKLEELRKKSQCEQ